MPSFSSSMRSSSSNTPSARELPMAVPASDAASQTDPQCIALTFSSISDCVRPVFLLKLIVSSSRSSSVVALSSWSRRCIRGLGLHQSSVVRPGFRLFALMTVGLGLVIWFAGLPVPTFAGLQPCSDRRLGLRRSTWGGVFAHLFSTSPCHSLQSSIRHRQALCEWVQEWQNILDRFANGAGPAGRSPGCL